MARRGERARTVVVADSDSYLKWAAGLFPKADPDLDSTVYVLRSSSEPRDSQVEAALRTTDWMPDEVRRIGVDELPALCEDADVLAVAVRGAMALVIGDAVVKRLSPRPVVVTGLPGMSIPARRRGLVYRSYADLFVVHSKTEVDAFENLAVDTPLTGKFALATLPFTTPSVTVRHDPAGAFVFATQAVVPATLRERRNLARGLLEYARQHPERELVIKIRNMEGEAQTHADTKPLQRLVLEACEGELPANMSIRAGAMVDALDGAAGLVTVSSTAALEALEYGQPVALVSDFGVRKTNLNGAFVGSGLMTRLRMIAPDVSRWPAPDLAWKDRNYFHPESDNTWRTRLSSLLLDHDRGALPSTVHLADSEFTRHERLYWSAAALPTHEHSHEQRRAVRRERRHRSLRRVRGRPLRFAGRLWRAARRQLFRTPGRPASPSPPGSEPPAG